MNIQSIFFVLISLVLVIITTPILTTSETISSAQSKLADVANLARPKFHIFNERDGLPQSSVQTMTFDHRGYLWAGTQDGVVYYNGRKWTEVDLRQYGVSSWVTTILATSDGSIWFGTADGLLRLKDEQWKNYKTDSGLPNNVILSLCESTAIGGQPSLLVGTYGGGLACFQKEKWSVYNVSSGLPDNNVHSIIETSSADGVAELWIGTTGGLAYLKQDKWKIYDTNSGLPSNFVKCLAKTIKSDGGTIIWAGTYDKGLAFLDNGSWKVVNTDSGLPENNVLSLLTTFDRKGQSTLWVGTYNKGLGRFQDGHWTTYDINSGLPNNAVLSLLAEGSSDTRSVWVGTFGGIARLNSNNWSTLDTKSGLPNNIITSLLETTSTDGLRKFWFGTDGKGLACFQNGKWAVYDQLTGFPHNTVLSLLEIESIDGKQEVWAGTYGGGIACWQNGQWTVLDTKSGLPNNFVLCLLSTKSETGKTVVWIGTNGGLAKWSDGKFKIYGINDGLPSERVWSLLETNDNNGNSIIWAGTKAGLACLKDNKWTVFNTSLGLPSNEIQSLMLTTNNNGQKLLWVGTNGSGIALLNLSSLEPTLVKLQENLQSLLTNKIINSICEDANKKIYIFTTKGVIRLTPEKTNNNNEYSIYTFTIEDGLPSNQCNFGAKFIDKKGRIWVGTIGGIGLFDPIAEFEDRTPKPLQIEHILINGKERKFSKDIQLAHNENDPSFEFALLSFFREIDTSYQTQLVGYDAKASEWTNEPKRVYTNLREGNYIFKVWGKDYAGNITTNTEIKFYIKSSPWRSWPAYFAYFTFAIVSSYSLFRLQIRRLEHKNKTLEAKIKERTIVLADTVEKLKVSQQIALKAEHMALEASHAKSIFLASMSHELRTPLNAILGFVQLMEREKGRNKDDKEHLSIISKSGEHLLALINDILSLSKIEAGKLTLNEQAFDILQLIQTIAEMFKQRATSKGIALILNLDTKMPQYVSGDEGKLRQVLINLLSNAIKFTIDGSVSFSVNYNHEQASFIVEDTGVGIDSSELDKLFEPFIQTRSGQQVKEGTGLGLAISRNFVRLMGGDISVRSELGKGTRFSFTIELPKVESPILENKEQKVIGLVPGQPKYRILVADDQIENRTLMTKLLFMDGIEIKTASNGQEALDIWQNWHPQLIWMDLHMPVMDGFTAIKKIREYDVNSNDSNNSSSHTVIIALTASAFEHEKVTTLASGCDDFVVKPFKTETIFQKISQHLAAKFVYEEPLKIEKSTLSSKQGVDLDKLKALPQPLLKSLQESLLLGDLEEIQQVIKQIKKQDELLASELESVAKSFSFDQLIKMVESSIS